MWRGGLAGLEGTPVSFLSITPVIISCAASIGLGHGEPMDYLVLTALGAHSERAGVCCDKGGITARWIHRRRLCGEREGRDPAEATRAGLWILCRGFWCEAALGARGTDHGVGGASEHQATRRPPWLCVYGLSRASQVLGIHTLPTPIQAQKYLLSPPCCFPSKNPCLQKHWCEMQHLLKVS